jgi:hypothetical protein
MLQLVPAVAVMAGVAIGLSAKRRRDRLTRLSVAVLAILMLCNVGTYAWRSFRPGGRNDTTIARFVRENAKPGDTIEVLYARADLLQLAGLRPAYRYAWSLMMRARPDAIPRLNALLASPQRPTWVIEWEDPATTGLDADGNTESLLAHYYVTAGDVCGKPVLVRVDERAGRERVPPSEACDGVVHVGFFSIPFENR